MTTNGGAAAPPGGGGSKRLAQQQAQVDEVVDIMRQNVDKVLERDKNLSLLDDRADKLQHNAAQFEQQAGKLKRKFWLKNMKMMIIMGVVGTIFTIVVIAWIASKVKTVTPVSPSGSAATPIPESNNEPVPVKVPGGSMAIPGGERRTTKRGRASRRSTTPSSNAGSTAATPNDGESAASNGNNEPMAAAKRAIRAIVH